MFSLTEKDVDRLVTCKRWIVRDLEGIVSEFYENQIADPEIALTIGDADTLERLQASMRRYIVELFEGYYDEEYVNKRLRVGKIHSRIGVTPKLYMSAVSLLLGILGDRIGIYCEEDGRPGDTKPTRRALQKLILFDSQLVFDTYIASMAAELEATRESVEARAKSLEDEVAERTRQLQDASMRDPLTSLYNQGAFNDMLRRELAAHERKGAPLSLVFIDLNRFKEINDTHGHEAGNAALVAVARSVVATFREIDVACRYGGDEFTIVMPETEADDAVAVCQRLFDQFDKIRPHPTTLSVGVAQTGPERFVSLDRLVKTADSLMFKAKADSENGAEHKVISELAGHHSSRDSGKREPAPCLPAAVST